MARSRQRWFVALAVVPGASLFMFSVAAASAQTLTDAVSSAPASSASAPSWPCHLAVTGESLAIAELAWEHSPTFRDQCRKLAAVGARVIVNPVSSREMFRAQTRIGTTSGGVTVAFAKVRPGRDALERLAHELEHVIEYVEGVKFLMDAQRSDSRVRLSAGAYETQRAIDTGRRVAEEVRARPKPQPHVIIASK